MRSSADTMPGKKRLHRANTFVGLFDLKEMRGSWNRFLFDRRFGGDRLADERRRRHPFALRIAADELHPDRHVGKPRPCGGVAITAKNMGLVLAWTRKYPLTGRGIVAQRRPRDQLVRLGRPFRETLLKLPRQIHRILVT